MPINDYARFLARTYHEIPVVHATQEGMPIVIFASPDGETYTIVVIIKDNVACAIGGGTDWVMRPQGGDPL